MKYYDDTTPESAKFISAYMNIIDAVENDDVISSETAAYLYCRGCNYYYRDTDSRRVREHTISQDLIDYCKENINLQYEELTEENYARFLDRIKESYMNPD